MWHSRAPQGTALLDTIMDQIENDARTFNCSRSWVAASIIARHYRDTSTPDFRQNVVKNGLDDLAKESRAKRAR